MKTIWCIAFFVFSISFANGAAIKKTIDKKAHSPNYLLSITAFEQLVELAIDGVAIPVDFNRSWTDPMLVQFTDVTRLVAFTAIARTDTEGESYCFGALSSVNDDYFLTSSKSCKCTDNGGPAYLRLGFDDSDWSPAVEYGCNACTDTSCFNDTVKGINGQAQWIWTDRSKVGEIAYCRCYLPMCEINNPCLNGGQCLPNSVDICSCPEHFEGKFCQIDSNNPCLNNPCKNGGTCLTINEDAGEYKCNCMFGFTGNDCSTRVTKLRLDVTAKEFLGAIYVEGVHIEELDNPTEWNKTMSLDIPYPTRLLAVAGSNINNSCSGIIASTDYGYFQTDATWKCSNAAILGWTLIGFNDSDWQDATVTGDNIKGVKNCDNNVTNIPAININAEWIWTAGGQDLTIYCRGYLPVCAARPCLNGGVCKQNEGPLCHCVPGYSGQFCQTVTQFPLSITANEDLEEVYIDGIRQKLNFNTDYKNVDTFNMKPTTRLIAAVAHDVNGLSGGCRGILGSVNFEGLVTSATWKCTNDARDGWFSLGFDDSQWTEAIERGTNTNEGSVCPGEVQPINKIFANASWIWTDPPEALVSFCRGYLSICTHVVTNTSSSACQNGGKCNNNAANLCTCTAGFTGTFCEYELGVDVPMPPDCSGKGVAIEVVPGSWVYRCECFDGYTGNNCESEIAPKCEVDTCLNGGTCSVVDNKLVCTCVDGFTGNQCEILPPVVKA